MSKLSITCCLFSPRKKMLCGKRVCSSSHSQFQKYFSLISPQHAKDIVHSTWMATRVPKRQAFVQQGFCAQWTGQQTEGKWWLVLSRDTFDLYTLIIEQRKKKTRSSTALSSTHISKSNQVQSTNKKKFSLKNATTVVNVQPPYPLHPSLSLTAIYCSSCPWTCACRHLLHSQTSDEKHLIAFHVATCSCLHRVSASLQHGCLSSIQTSATFPFSAHFIPQCSPSEFLMAVPLHFTYLCLKLCSRLSC